MMIYKIRHPDKITYAKCYSCKILSVIYAYRDEQPFCVTCDYKVEVAAAITSLERRN